MEYDPKISGQVIAGGNQWNATCPYCHKDGHFYMNIKNGLWDCKSCGKTGNWFKFAKDFDLGKINKKRIIKEKIRDILKTNRIRNVLLDDEDKTNKLFNIKLNNKVLTRFRYKKPKTIIMPSNFIKINKQDTPEVLRYIAHRHFPSQFIKTFNLRFGTVGGYFNRLIIPIYLDNKLKAYLGRWLPIKSIKVKRKYRNTYGVDFSHLLGNYDMIDNKEPVIICEGAFSSWRINKNSVYSFGKKLSESQIYLLRKKGVKEILILFDSDAHKESIKVVERLYEYESFSVRILLLKDGDPDDLNNDDNKLYENLLDRSFIYKPKTLVPKINIKNF